ncbi:MAG TPA: hypothetical protein VNM87_05525, partial [Candidatus Udaeobacter sp.]|nr:hypothetical protein [Candidatus Udaeobacter sp.]
MVSSGRERGGKRVGARRSGFLIALGLVALAPAGASQPLPMWKADHMQVAIQILPHDRIRVEEQIALDLGYERHRQLER